jgi:hypothetical protein
MLVNVMTNRLVAERDISEPSSANETAQDQTFVCWSRMQAEAGQALDAIIRRKELERQSNGGIFIWGVGNAPARLTRVLAHAGQPVRVIFSIMKSKPKAADAQAEHLLVWRAYIDAEGVERALPSGSIVTSRAGTATKLKRAHYALVCRSERGLDLDKNGVRFDPEAFRNAGEQGRPVGASQVTALLRQVAGQRSNGPYAVNMEAELTGGYWVRLTSPMLLARRALSALDRAENMGVEAWRDLARRLREPEVAQAERGTLL